MRAKSNTLRTRGIYAIVNTVTGRMYIGKSSLRFPERWCMHRGDLNRGVHWNKELQKDWTLYGSDIFEFRVIETVPMGSRKIVYDQLERAHIQSAIAPLYNILVYPSDNN